MKNKSFRALLICTTGIVGYFNIYGVVINEILDKYKITPNQTSILGIISNLSGLIGSVLISILIDKLRKYKKVFIIINCLSIVFHFAMTVLLEVTPDNAFIIAMILWTSVTICIIPIFTIGMDFVVELTYPVGESISGGVIMTFNQLSGIFGVRILIIII